MTPLLPDHALPIIGDGRAPWGAAISHPLTLAGLMFDAVVTFDGEVDGVLVTTDFDIDVDGPTASKSVDPCWQPATSLRWSGGASVSSLHFPGIVISPKLNAFGVHIGDYCAVIYNGRVVPAQVYDDGPTYKAGEGSAYCGRKAGIVLANQSDHHAATVGNSVTDAVTLFFPGSGPGHAVAPELIEMAVLALWRKFVNQPAAVFPS